MRRNSKVSSSVSVLMACIVAGCASYAPALVKLDPSGPRVSKAVQGNLTLYVEEYATPEKSKKAFDSELAEEGVLPLLVLVENGGQQPYEVRAAEILVRGDTALKALTPEEAAGKAKRSAVGRAIGWSLLVPIVAIPIAAYASASHTSKVNEQIVSDFTAKAFSDGIMMPHKERSGFVFYELEKGRKDLAGLSLEVTAKNVVTGEVVTVATPLPAATFERKEGVPPEQKDAASSEKASVTVEPAAEIARGEQVGSRLQSQQPAAVVAKVEPDSIPSEASGPFANIVGTWSGRIEFGPKRRATTGDGPLTMTIKEDGMYDAVSPSPSKGNIRVVGGKYQLMLGGETFTLALEHRAGKRVLKGSNYDSSLLCELTQEKESEKPSTK